MSLDKQLESLYNLSADTRGRFLDQTIVIERLIDDIVSRHFCPTCISFPQRRQSKPNARALNKVLGAYRCTKCGAWFKAKKVSNS